MARQALTVNWLADGRIFAVGGITGPDDPSDAVEMLHWPWNIDEPMKPGWISLKPLLNPRCHHGAAFVSGKLVVAGGDSEGSAEIFTPPCLEFPEGQWTKIRPVQEGVMLVGMVPFGEGLLAVSKCLFAFHLRFFHGETDHKTHLIFLLLSKATFYKSTAERSHFNIFFLARPLNLAAMSDLRSGV